MLIREACYAFVAMGRAARRRPITAVPPSSNRPNATKVASFQATRESALPAFAGVVWDEAAPVDVAPGEPTTGRTAPRVELGAPPSPTTTAPIIPGWMMQK